MKNIIKIVKPKLIEVIGGYIDGNEIIYISMPKKYRPNKPLCYSRILLKNCSKRFKKNFQNFDIGIQFVNDNLGGFNNY